MELHIKRLFDSAQTINLKHRLSKQIISNNIIQLTKKISNKSYNLKIFLIGGNKPMLIIFPLLPLYPDKKFYKYGVKLTIKEYERQYPTAKTLNMLGNYIAYKEAKKTNCY